MLAEKWDGKTLLPSPQEQQDRVSHQWVRICLPSVAEGAQHHAVPLQRSAGCWGAFCSVLPGLVGASFCPGFAEKLFLVPPSVDPARSGCSGTAIGFAGKMHPSPQCFPSRTFLLEMHFS